MKCRIIIAGGRDFDDFPLLYESANEIIKRIISYEKINNNDISIISGKARGADTLGEQYANQKQYKIYEFPADWDKLGKKAGYVRNKQMAQFASEDNCYGVLIAFWDGTSRGTKHMIDLAKEYELDVYVIRYGEGIKLENDLIHRLIISLTQNGGTDSDIYDFCNENNISMRKFEDTYAKYIFKGTKCENCKYNTYNLTAGSIGKCCSCNQNPKFKNYFETE